MAFIEVRGAAGVITGAGSGIGRATAIELARRGMRVVVSDRLEERAVATVATIRELGGDAVALRVDVTDERDLEALRDACLAHFGQIDLVMNNVGVIAMGPPETLPLAEWQRVIDINLLGIVRSNLVFLPHLIAQGRGHVINTASVSGLLAHGYDRLPYVTTKHAVVGMTESLALYLRPLGIGVTCVCPSGVATNIVEQITFHGTPSRPRSPDHPIVDADVVGRLVADAVEQDRFLVLTVPAVVEELVERARDLDRYVRERTGPSTDDPSADPAPSRRDVGRRVFEEANGFPAPETLHPISEFTVEEAWLKRAT
jgi:NAD(P)-dependent dehydrogenase (short-subunit alcohol dehydrogenase family)